MTTFTYLKHARQYDLVKPPPVAVARTGDQPLQFLLEQQILEEQEDVEELERYLRRAKLEDTAVLRVA